MGYVSYELMAGLFIGFEAVLHEIEGMSQFLPSHRLLGPGYLMSKSPDAISDAQLPPIH